MAEGMVRVRFSPTHIPTRPSSQPLITCPTPTTGGEMGLIKGLGNREFGEIERTCQWQRLAAIVATVAHSISLRSAKSGNKKGTKESSCIPRVKFVAIG